MKVSRTTRYLGVILAIAFLAAPAIRSSTAFATTKTFFEGTANYACVGTCSGSHLIGVEVDRPNNVIYAVDDFHNQLIQIDGTNPSNNNTYSLPNCNDPRRPAVAHDSVSADTKVYVGCETAHKVLSFDFPTAMGPPSGTPKSISLKYTTGGTTRTFEPKTERANDHLGIVYVVGDCPTNCFGAFSTDPGFAIDAHTDKVTAVNASLGNSGGNTCGDNGTSSCGGFVSHQGNNDVAIAPVGSRSADKVFWFNEDDHKVWRTNPDLTQATSSGPVPHPCDTDAPSHGAVTDGETTMENVSGNLEIMATASEAARPCSGTSESPNSAETGAVYAGIDTTVSPTLTRQYLELPRFQAGAIVEADGEFLIANISSDTQMTDCVVSCVQIRSLNEGLKDTIPLKEGQTDIAWNSSEEEAWATLPRDAQNTYNLAYFSTS